MTETKLCKDCKHYRCNWKTIWSPYCARKVVTCTSVITGETTTKTELEPCASQRLVARGSSDLELWLIVAEKDLSDKYCGKSGRHWEAK